ncbi:hypothetical protein GIB67_006955, partial [Kingdonia uniflora]
EVLNEQNAKLVKDLRIQAAVDDCNAILSRELAKKDLRIKIGVDASKANLALEFAKERRECKLLQDINANLPDQSERQHPAPVPLVVIPKREAAPSPDL